MSEVREKAKHLCVVLQERGHKAVFAGGCVRDQILNIQPKDYDICTSAKPDEIERVFTEDCPLKTIPVGKSFGVITVVVGTDSFEIATFREDGEYTDGRRPEEVRFVETLREDAARRDFTMNSMFFDPVSGHLIDYFRGREDLEMKILRFVGEDYRRLAEDRLRALRAVRFSLKYRLNIPYESEKEIRRTCIRKISRERISDEFRKILVMEDSLEALEYLNLMQKVIPGIEAAWGLGGVQDSKYHAEGDVWTHTKMVVSELRKLAPDNFELLLAGVLHDIAKPATQCCGPEGRVTNLGHAEIGETMARNICAHWLKLSNEQIKKVSSLVGWHMKMHHVQKWSQDQLNDLYCNPYFEDMMFLQHADSTGRIGESAGSSNMEFLKEFRSRTDELPATMKPGAPPIITGKDLLDLGLSHCGTYSFKARLGALKRKQEKGELTYENKAQALQEEKYVWLLKTHKSKEDR